MKSRRHFMTYCVPKKIVPGFDLTGGFFHGVGLTKRCQPVLEDNNDTLSTIFKNYEGNHKKWNCPKLFDHIFSVKYG